MTSKINPAERERQAEVQRLLDEREQLFPNEQYPDRFAAVMSSEKGIAIAAQQHLSNQDAVPVFNPRSAALVGLKYPQDKELFRERWLRTHGPVVGGAPSPTYPSAEESRRSTLSASGGKFEGDVEVKEAGKQGFLKLVSDLMLDNRTRDEAWAEAVSSPEGARLYVQWLRGTHQVKSGP